MRLATVTAVVMLGTYAGAVFAGCQPGQRLNQNEVGKLLAGNTVCGRPVMPAEGGAYPGKASDRWQEEHFGAAPAGGAMWDFKKGDSDKVDPRKQVGTWSIVQIAPSVFGVRHAYLGGAQYDWTVHSIPAAPGQYSFCARTSEFVRGKIKAGTNVGCTAGDFPP